MRGNGCISVSPRAEQRGNEQQLRSTKPRLTDLHRIVNPGGAAFRFVDKQQASRAGRRAEARVQPLALAAGKAVVAEEDAASPWQARDQSQQLAVQALIGHEPLAWDGLAGPHAPSYSRSS
jgi:hypothetical protein